VGLGGFVVGIARGLKENDKGDTSGHFLDVADFVFCERPSE
jgi:hypothetical protein